MFPKDPVAYVGLFLIGLFAVLYTIGLHNSAVSGIGFLGFLIYGLKTFIPA